MQIWLHLSNGQSDVNDPALVDYILRWISICIRIGWQSEELKSVITSFCCWPCFSCCTGPGNSSSPSCIGLTIGTYLQIVPMTSVDRPTHHVDCVITFALSLHRGPAVCMPHTAIVDCKNIISVVTNWPFVEHVIKAALTAVDVPIAWRLQVLPEVTVNDCHLWPPPWCVMSRT